METVSSAVGRILSRPKKTLIVDDDNTWLSYLTTVCSHFNVEIKTCEFCRTARNVLNTEKFDLLLLDVRLTNGNGVQLYREFATINPAMQTVFLTGYGTEEVQKDIEKIGPARIFGKERMLDPMFAEQLMAQIGAARVGTGNPFPA